LNQYWVSRGFVNPNSLPQDCSIINQNAQIPGGNSNEHPTSQRYANPLHFAYDTLSPSSTSPPVQVKEEIKSPSIYCQPPCSSQGNQFVPQQSTVISAPQSPVCLGNLPAMNSGSASLEEQRRMSLSAQSFHNNLLATPINEATSQQQPAEQTSFNPDPYFDPATHVTNFSPLSANLPLNQQQIIGYALNPTNPSTQILMAGSEGMPQPFLFNCNPVGPTKSADGNQTLVSNHLEVIPIDENPAFATTFSSPSPNTTEYFQAMAWAPNQLSFDFDDSIGSKLSQIQTDLSKE